MLMLVKASVILFKNFLMRMILRVLMMLSMLMGLVIKALTAKKSHLKRASKIR